MRKRMMNETPSDTEQRIKKESREIEAKGLAVPVDEPKVKVEVKATKKIPDKKTKILKRRR